MIRSIVCTLTLITFAWFLASAIQGGDGNASPWKAFLPADAYKELTQRSIKRIEEIAKSDAKDAAERIEVEAVLLRGYTLSTKNGSDEALAKLRGAAQQAMQTKDVAKLRDFAKFAAAAPSAPADQKPKHLPHSLANVMELFRGKAKGGEGLHADLQYQPKLKNLNGIEPFIGALAAKKLTDANLNKISGELPRLAYRIAVVGALTHELAPEKNTAKWRELSVQMRDASIALAEAAEKKDSEAVFKSAAALENSCIQCHREFQNK